MIADDDLTEPELRVVAAIATGTDVDLRAFDPRLDNPARFAEWPSARTIRAELLAELVTAERPPPTGKPKALRLRGAHITGELNLEAATMVCPLWLVDCHFDRPVTLREAEAQSLGLSGCHIPGIEADHLRTRGNLDLRGIVVHNAQIRLNSAQIGGFLDLSGARLENRKGCVLSAEGLVVNGSMFCGEGFIARGEVRLTGARLGQLYFTGALLSNEGGRALFAEHITVELGMSCDRLITNGQVRLGGARIGGQLSFADASLACAGESALRADGLTVEGSMFCSGAFTSVGEVRLIGAHVGDQLVFSGASITNQQGQALTAELLTVDKGILFRDKFNATGQVSLVGSHIKGQIDFGGARLANPDGIALNGDGLVVEDAMFCNKGFTAEGEVRLLGAKIGGELSFYEAKLINPKKSALNADGLTVNNDARCGKVTVRGEVRLDGARIGGYLYLSGAKLLNPNGSALDAQRLTVGRTMFCGDGFIALGEVHLNSAKIAGQLELSGARLANRGGRALNAYGLAIAQDMRCVKLAALGEVSLQGAKIGGALSFYEAKLINPKKRALNADGLTVGNNVYCGKVTARGEVSLDGARIDGYLYLIGAKLLNPNGSALNAQRLTVGRTMFCTLGFKVQGLVGLVAANIVGQLVFSKASISNAEDVAIDLERARVDSLVIEPDTRFDGVVDMTNARVSTFEDNRETWPEKIRLLGFSYEVLSNDTVSVKDRLGWLARNQDGYAPGPYDQLSAAYRRVGRVTEARRVAVAKQWCRRSELRLLGKVWNWLLYLTVGYGYRTWLAALWLGALLTVGAAVFASGYPDHFRPASATVPDFQPVAYAIDVLVPLVDLGQRKAWLAHDYAQILSWAMTGTGWLLTTAVVAGLTNALKRD